MGLCNGKYSGTVRLDKKTAIITGCNTGIGRFTAMDFYKRGCRVIMACRSLEKAKATQEEILKKCSGNLGNGALVLWDLDLSSLTSVRKFAANIMDTEPTIHLLINNAGVMACPKSFTEDGFEMQFGTNHLGHFLLTLLLLPRILNSTPARIINLSSLVHENAVPIDWDDLKAEKSYDPYKNYQKSKLANVMFTAELARRLEGRDVKAYSVHPGAVFTELHRHFSTSFFPGAVRLWEIIGPFVLKTEEEGAQTTLYCALDEEAGEETGLYYADCKKKPMNPEARKLENAKKLWEVSAELVNLGDFDPFNTPDQPLLKIADKIIELKMPEIV